jgi:hypothetical protein
MPDDPTRTSDLAKAREIIRRYGIFVFQPDTAAYDEVIKAIADGIAFGRNDGIAMVAKDILRRKGGSNA